MKRFAFALLLCLPLCAVAQYGAKVGGIIAPDGVTELQCQLPGELHRKNTASHGLGLCVFTSIHHSALYQDIPALQELPKWMIQKGIAGGGWDAKVDKIIKQKCAEVSAPIPDYIQITDTPAKVFELLKLACATNRMPCITYSVSPTGRYGGSKIAHMVNLPSAGAGSQNWYAYLDNNYMPTKDLAHPDNYEWCTESEAAKASGQGGKIWAIVFLSPGPPPEPEPGLNLPEPVR